MENKKTILVVEDDVPVLSLIVEKLSREGYDVLEARDGKAGLKLGMKEKPDLILLDILIPKMSGLIMMEKLRNDGEWAKVVPIILLTNLTPDSEEIIEAVKKYKAEDYLIKTDWSLNKVVERIKGVLK